MKPHYSAGLAAFLAAVVLTGCGSAAPQAAPPETARELVSPAGADSGQPNLATGPGGETYLSWIETTESGTPALKFAVMRNDKWSAAQTIVQSDDLVVNYADFPSLLPLAGGVLAAHWMTEIPHSDGYRVEIAFSRDGGRTWSKPVIPHRDSTATEHGFVSMIPAPGGGLGAVWLDSRKLAGKKEDSGGDVAMMYTSVGQDGKLGPETTIDGRVCECCQPSAVETSKGVLVAYRGRSQSEVRDITTVRFDDQLRQWSQPKKVYLDNWVIDGCPINGPAAAARDSRVVVAWFTAPGDKPKVEAAFSSDAGDSFGLPVQVDDGSPVGRVGVVMLDSGSAIVAWLEKSDQGVQLRASRVEADGTRHGSMVIGTTGSGTSGGFPRIARSGGTVIFAWTDNKANRIRVAVLENKK